MVNTQPLRTRGVKVLKAVSSPLRLQILNLLFDKSALSYTELMNELKMNPSRDAGRFAYHLKFMLNACLVEADVEAKKYFLTDLGKMVLDVADRVEKKAVKPRGMLVRTSHLAVEEFDANKIANSLIKEAKVPAELAQKVAKEAEKRLTKSRIKYLTAPLIREVVNGILVEKGFEDFRHKLTRVGMPIHEVTALIESKDVAPGSQSAIQVAGHTVIGEYTLLNVLPRDIADAHLSGAIHIDDLGTWVLKPSDIIHDIRYFLQSGIKPENPKWTSMSPPKDFETALSLAFNILLHASKETNSAQAFNHINIALAPYARGIAVGKLKENLRAFILNINQHVETTLGLELCIPKLTSEKQSIGPQGKTDSKYGDYSQECLQITSLIIDICLEESIQKPLFNPKIVLKINSETLINQNAKPIFLKAHQIAVQGGVVYFGNFTKKDMENASYSSSGIKFTTDLTGDWETDTLRTGCLGSVIINLPRIAMESEHDETKFIDIFKERLELAARALTIKSNALKQFGKNNLPFLLQKLNGDTYFRLENCSRIINLAGLKEAVEVFTGKSFNSNEGRKFAEEIITGATSFKQKVGRKYGKRLYSAVLSNREAAERLAVLDIERYGIAKVKFSGTRDKPYYSTLNRVHIKSGLPLLAPTGTAETAQLFKRIRVGGSLDILDLDDNEYDPDALMDLTQRIIENSASEFFTYNRAMCYCSNCKKKFHGVHHKCPTCGSMSTLATFDRFTSA